MSENNWKSLIGDAHQRLFVGREPELAQCRAFVDEMERRVLYLHGVGGIGKTTLLRELNRYAEEQGWQTRWLDATVHGDSAPALERAVLDAAATDSDDPVLLCLDNFETIAPLETWMRDSLFPKLPSNLWLAMAGRPRLSQSWRLDSAWSQLTTSVRLEPFDDHESRAFLEARGVDAHRRDEILEMARGMPIALALAAENALQEYDTEELLSAEDISDLMKRLTQRHATPPQRRALHVAGMAWAVTEGLLEAVVEDGDAHELMVWLADQPYMQLTGEGLQPHPLVRELIDEQFRATSPEERLELRDSLKNTYFRQMRESGFARQQNISFNIVFLGRGGRGAAPRNLGQSESLYFDRPAADDDIASLIEQFEGPASAEIASHYLNRFPEHAHAIRGANGVLEGFIQIIPLEQCTDDEPDIDPAVGLALAELDNLGGLRDGETARMARFWFSVDTYQSDGPVQGRIMMKIMQEVATVPGASHGISVHRDPDYWDRRRDKFLRKLGEFELDEHAFAIYSRDWRRFDKVEFLERHLTFALTGDGPTSPIEPRYDVLAEDEFADAVRDALKNFHRGDRLVHGALARCRVTVSADSFDAAPEHTEARVRELLENTIDSLGDEGEDSVHREILRRTFVEPAAKQRAVAEEISMSFGTYRRKLNEGIDRVVARLWHREIHGPE